MRLSISDFSCFLAVRRSFIFLLLSQTSLPKSTTPDFWYIASNESRKSRLCFFDTFAMAPSKTIVCCDISVALVLIGVWIEILDPKEVIPSFVRYHPWDKIWSGITTLPPHATKESVTDADAPDFVKVSVATPNGLADNPRSIELTKDRSPEHHIVELGDLCK